MKKKYLLITKILGLGLLTIAAPLAKAQYCTTSLYSYGCGAYGDEIESVSTSGGSTNISNINSGCSGGYAGYGYITNKGTLTIQAGQSFTITVVNNPSYYEYYAIYVDFNGDQDFSDPGETVFQASTSTQYSATVNGGPITVPVPTSATAGNTRLRVRCVYGSSPTSACAYHNGGEIEDYPMVIVPACNGPVFTAHPANQNFCAGASANFSATATSAATYRWQVNSGSGYTDINNNTVYSNATTNALSLNNIPASYASYLYRLKAVSSCGTPSYSNPATLTFFPPVAVTSQTQNLTACADAYSELNVAASGPVSTYQWQIGTLTNGYTNLPAQYPYLGTNSSKLEITSTHDTINGLSYRCIVYGPCTQDTSAAIPVDVIIGPYISDNPADDTVLPYQNAYFEIKSLGSSNYELYWQASTDNGATFVNINNNSLYIGAQGIRLVVNAPNPGLSGMQFRCILKSTDPACGLFRDTSAAATLYVGNYTSVADVNANQKFDITLYPNPVNGNELFINAANIPANEIHIRIFDKLGRILYETDTKLAANKIVNVPVQNIVPGIYSIQVTDADNNILSTSAFTRQ